MSRRLSYASVVAGHAAASASRDTSSATAQSAAFAHLMNPYPHSSSYGQAQESDPRRQAQSAPLDTYSPNIPTTWGKASNMSSLSYPAPNDRHSRGGSNGDGLMRPSYLKGSRYMKRLEAANRAKLAAERKAEASQGHHDGGSISRSSSSMSLQRMAPSHRGMTYEIVESNPPVEEEIVSPLPTKFTEVDRAGGLELSGDGQEVRWVGAGKSQDQEYAAARADHFMPPECGLYYYEVTVISKVKDGWVLWLVGMA